MASGDEQLPAPDDGPVLIVIQPLAEVPTEEAADSADRKPWGCGSYTVLLEHSYALIHTGGTDGRFV